MEKDLLLGETTAEVPVLHKLLSVWFVAVAAVAVVALKRIV